MPKPTTYDDGSDYCATEGAFPLDPEYLEAMKAAPPWFLDPENFDRTDDYDEGLELEEGYDEHV